jgi:hypothetical protein
MSSLLKPTTEHLGSRSAYLDDYVTAAILASTGRATVVRSRAHGPSGTTTAGSIVGRHTNDLDIASKIDGPRLVLRIPTATVSHCAPPM